MALEAVTFDYWNTLVRMGDDVRGPRLRALRDALAETGHHHEIDVVDGALGAVRDRQDDHWRRNEQYVLDDGVADLLTVLGVPADPEVAAVVRARWIANGRAVDVELTEPRDTVAGTLDELAGFGVRLGIVCDVGLMPSSVLRGHLERFGLLDRFDHWSFSDETGVYKPDRRAFDHALDGLGVADATRCLHIGDLHRTDVLGARGRGMQAVRYTGWVSDPDAPATDPGPVLDTLAGLVGLATH